jgi:CMP/dCMP kinase
MAVITMSRQVGSGSQELAQLLCAELGLNAFDKYTMLRVASEVGISPEEVIDYSEAEYERRGFLDELLRRSRTVAESSMWIGSPDIGYERRSRILDEYDAISMVRATILAAYERDQVLIIGRGGQAILEYKPDVLHVRVVAPMEERLARVEAQQELDRSKARRYLQDSDANTAEYLRTFYHIDPDDPTLYHLVVNTGLLGIEGAASLIKESFVKLPQRAADVDDQKIA